MERSRRTGTKRTPHEKFAELRELRKSGKTRLSTYQVEEQEDLYDEVDDKDYEEVVRTRLEQDDFVVDDNGEGYADNGMDDWGDEERKREQSWDESEEDDKKGKGKSAKRKRAEEVKRKQEQDGNISKYFSAANIVPTIKAKKVANVFSTVTMYWFLLTRVCMCSRWPRKNLITSWTPFWESSIVKCLC